MPASLGDFDASAVVYGKFTTYRPSTGAPFTLAGTPALSVYKDNSTTQSTAGVTLTVDFDSVTGLHHFAIDTSADGAFYAAGSFFDIVITTGTVDSVSAVGTVVGSFTLRKTSALKPTTAGRALDVSAGGNAGIDWANVENPTTALNLSGTNIDTDQVVASVTGTVTANVTQIGGDAQSATDLKDFADAGYDPLTNKVEGVKLADTLTTYTGNTPQTGDAFARLGAPAGASIAADLAAIEAQTDDIGAAGAGLTAIPWNAAWDAEVESEATDALNAYDPPTNAEMTARTLATADYGTAANQATLLNRLGAFTGSGLNTALGFLRALLRKDAALTPSDVGGTYDNTTDSLEAIKDGGLPVTGTVTVGTNNDKTGYGLSDGALTAAKFGAGALDANALAADAAQEIATALLDLANGVESGETVRQFFRKLRAVAMGVSDDDATPGTVVFKRKDGTTTSLTVVFADGSRSSVTDGTN